MSKRKLHLRRRLEEAQAWRCAYCWGSMVEGGEAPNAVTIEHVTVERYGGAHAEDNLVAACRGCNGGRSGFHGAERFARLRRRLLRIGIWPACSQPSRRISKWLARLARDWPDPQYGLQEFSRDRVLRHSERHHPQCPAEARKEIVKRVVGRVWRRAPLGAAVGIVVTYYIRREHTDYLALLRIPGLTSEEARLIVAPQVAEVIAQWRSDTVALPD